jgi:hypothetical protein
MEAESPPTLKLWQTKPAYTEGPSYAGASADMPADKARSATGRRAAGLRADKSSHFAESGIPNAKYLRVPAEGTDSPD